MDSCRASEKSLNSGFNTLRKTPGDVAPDQADGNRQDDYPAGCHQENGYPGMTLIDGCFPGKGQADISEDENEKH